MWQLRHNPAASVGACLIRFGDDSRESGVDIAATAGDWV
jgi:hypothetical protein